MCAVSGALTSACFKADAVCGNYFVGLSRASSSAKEMLML